MRRSAPLRREPEVLHGAVEAGSRAVRLRCWLIGAAGVAVLAAGVLSLDASSDGPGSRTAVASVPDLAVDAGPAGAPLHPGGVSTGSLLVSNPGDRMRHVKAADLAPPTADGPCRNPGVAVALTVPPTPESPLVIPAGSTVALEHTAYMDGESDHGCQGAVLTSAVSLDGERAGAITLTAGRLEPPPAPTGGLTTSTRAAVRWSASTAAAPGWVLERAVAGTADWQPACGSSAARPVRALSCTDTGLTRSTAYLYRVTVRSGHWHATSRPSRPVTTQARPSA